MTVQTQEIQKREGQSLEQAERTRSRRIFSPRADVYEAAEAIAVVAEMPGVAEGGVDITIEKNVLTIRGAVEARTSEGYRQVYSEYGEGDYERSFILSDTVDHERIEAALKNGVLRLKLPKVKEALARKIQVKAE